MGFAWIACSGVFGWVNDMDDGGRLFLDVEEWARGESGKIE